MAFVDVTLQIRHGSSCLCTDTWLSYDSNFGPKLDAPGFEEAWTAFPSCVSPPLLPLVSGPECNTSLPAVFTTSCSISASCPPVALSYYMGLMFNNSWLLVRELSVSGWFSLSADETEIMQRDTTEHLSHKQTFDALLLKCLCCESISCRLNVNTSALTPWACLFTAPVLWMFGGMTRRGKLHRFDKRKQETEW